MTTFRAFRSLKLPGLIAADLQLEGRQSGCAGSEYRESAVLQTAGGDRPAEILWLAGSGCLERGLGF